MNYLYATGIVIGAILAFAGILLYCMWAYYEAEYKDNEWPIWIPAGLAFLALIAWAVFVVADKIEG